MTASSWHTYPSIFSLGHKAVADLLERDVIVQEKVDGAQFSFGKFDSETSASPELRFRSKGADIHEGNVPKMFKRAVETITMLKGNLMEGWTYRGEVLDKPKHNVLGYDRTPAGHVILFDINNGQEDYLSAEEVKMEANRIGLEVVPCLYGGPGQALSLEHIQEFLKQKSCLGDVLIEGVVIKPFKYNLFGQDKKVIMGKYVREAFKEKHANEWKTMNPSRGDMIMLMSEEYRTQARWQKALQHLRDAGEEVDTVSIIGKFIKEVQQDLCKEEATEIADRLLKWALPQIQRNVSRGAAEWFKEQLLAKQFEKEV